VNELPDTATADCAARFNDDEVTLGIKEVTFMPVRLNVMLDADEPLFVATMTYLLPDGSLYAEHVTPLAGPEVASILT